MTAPTTEAEIRGAQDVALFFPPVRDIRIVLYAALPIGVLTLVSFYAFLYGSYSAGIGLAVAAGLLTLVSWFFFLRAMRTPSIEPTALPPYYAGWSVPIRFQPEIRWQAIKLAIRSAATLVIFFAVLLAMSVYLEGRDVAAEMLRDIGPIYFGVIVGGGFISIPPLALMLSRYGLHKSGRRERDGGLPKSLIRRREAAIEALRRKWPDAVPVET